MTQETSSERLPKSGMETGKREYGRAGGSGNSNRTRFQCRMIFLRFSPYKWLIKFCSCVEFKEKRTERAPLRLDFKGLRIQNQYRSSRPLDEGGTGPPKIFFPPFGPHFGLKIRGCGPPLDLPLARLIFNVLRSDFHTSLQSVIFITLAAR